MDMVGGRGLYGKRAGVEPLEEPFEGFRFLFREADGLVEAFGEGGVQSGSEEGRGLGEEFFMHDVLRLRPGLAVDFANDYCCYALEVAKVGAKDWSVG
jgi:hypothetical protein